MKATFITIFLFFILTHNAKAQVIDSVKQPSFDKEQLLSKSRTQKIVGWTMFGTGLPIVIVTGYLMATTTKNDINKSLLTGVFIASTVYTLLSIPLLHAGSLNKRRAMSMSFGNNKILIPSLASFNVKMQPTISLHLSLN